MIIEESTFLTVYIFVVMGIFGAVFGSFINCMAWRIAHGESVLKGRSHCAVCGHPLGAADLVPVFSFLLQILQRKDFTSLCGGRTADGGGISSHGMALWFILADLVDLRPGLYSDDFVTGGPGNLPHSRPFYYCGDRMVLWRSDLR